MKTTNQNLNLSLVLSPIILLGLVGCSGYNSSSNSSAADGLAASLTNTSPALAKDIVSRYGYSVEEYWKIVDSARVNSNLKFPDPKLESLMSNCTPVVTEQDGALEKIELVNQTNPDLCRIHFLYEKTISGPASNQTIALKMVMKFKDPSDGEFIDFQSLECSSSGQGSETSTSADVSFTSQCQAVDSFYGQFQAAYSGQIKVEDSNVRVVIDALITTPGSVDKGMQAGTAQVHYVHDTTQGADSFTFNGETVTSYESVGWMYGLRVN